MRSVVLAIIALSLAGCGHRDKKAPCGPMVMAFAETPRAPEPFASMEDKCGEAKPVNGFVKLRSPDARE